MSRSWSGSSAVDRRSAPAASPHSPVKDARLLRVVRVARWSACGPSTAGKTARAAPRPAPAAQPAARPAGHRAPPGRGPAPAAPRGARRAAPGPGRRGPGLRTPPVYASTGARGSTTWPARPATGCPASGTRFRYFLVRCYNEGRGKAGLAALNGTRTSTSIERDYTAVSPWLARRTRVIQRLLAATLPGRLRAARPFVRCASSHPVSLACG